MESTLVWNLNMTTMEVNNLMWFSSTWVIIHINWLALRVMQYVHGLFHEKMVKIIGRRLSKAFVSFTLQTDIENHNTSMCHTKVEMLVDVCHTKKNKLQYEMLKFNRKWW